MENNHEIGLLVGIKPWNETMIKGVYESLTTNWEANGGKPRVVGLVKLDYSAMMRQVLRYKAVFPNGVVDYLRLDLFDSYFEFVDEVIE